MKDKELISKKLTHTRKILGMTQSEIARANSIPQSNISAWEKGTRMPPPHYLIWLVSVGIDINPILDTKVSFDEYAAICNKTAKPRCASCVEKELSLAEKDRILAERDQRISELLNSIRTKDTLIDLLQSGRSETQHSKAG